MIHDAPDSLWPQGLAGMPATSSCTQWGGQLHLVHALSLGTTLHSLLCRHSNRLPVGAFRYNAAYKEGVRLHCAMLLGLNKVSHGLLLAALIPMPHLQVIYTPAGQRLSVKVQSPLHHKLLISMRLDHLARALTIEWQEPS